MDTFDKSNKQKNIFTQKTNFLKPLRENKKTKRNRILLRLTQCISQKISKNGTQLV